MNDYRELENIIDYHFTDKKKLDIAFTHKSYSNQITTNNKSSYERFEFLGDAVLEFLVSRYLFDEYKDKSEGELTKLRASLVCEFTLSKISRELKLGSYGYFSKGEKMTGGPNRDSILCDMFESLLGAIYLDGGIDEAKKFVSKFLLTDIEHKQLFYDAKSKLQEYAQKNNSKVVYELIEESGPEHEKTFKVRASIKGEVLAYGCGHSIKNAEQTAAFEALKKID